MKIVFTSCFDAESDPVQAVWERVVALQPDVLLLLGDSIYMDFGITGKRALGEPRGYSLEAFAANMHGLYARQWGVASFQRLVHSGLRVGMTWDDHDFAWNDSRGAGTQKKYAVSPERKRISRGLHLQFRQVLETRQLGSAYPACPAIAQLLAEPDAGIQSLFDVGGVRFVMLDGRTFRPDPREPDWLEPISTMHGSEQMNWLIDNLNNFAGIKIVGAGSVMSGGKEAWDRYLDYEMLLARAPKGVVVLTGDIHKNKRPRNHRPGRVPLYEITASGAARPGPVHVFPRLAGASGNFGVLEINGGEVEVTLYDRHGAGRPERLAF